MIVPPRFFRLAEYLRPAVGDPIRTVVVATADATIIAWHVAQGQTIKAHLHPAGQDTWTIISGRGDYVFAAAGPTQAVGPGEVVIARPGDIHGVHNPHPEPLIFVSVVCPLDAGYQVLASVSETVS